MCVCVWLWGCCTRKGYEKREKEGLKEGGEERKRTKEEGGGEKEEEKGRVSGKTRA